MSFTPEDTAGYSSPMVSSAHSAAGPTSFLPQQSSAATSRLQGASLSGDQPAMLVLLPTMEQATSLTKTHVGIARRSGAKLSSEQGAKGEAMLRILGSPSEIATACYLVQQAIWLNSVM